MLPWYETHEIQDELIQFVVMVTAYQGKWVIIKNKKRGGWEIPGGNKEKGEACLAAAARELYEETGAVHFELEPFGIYKWNGSYGMVYFAEIFGLERLPDFEIEEMKLVEQYPEGLNFGGMFYLFLEQWECYERKHKNRYSFDKRQAAT
ncbi:NUDIX domain-containing protein [Paenibacillus sp. GD4]|uniref:NUDIX domain-containing protein n=1 Tax=Paenibacillus sp. GD4 TaxID=3068890 RepID=UPI0027967849|nr:NUDIX domain-containing protein [Paenibacillus sp. GD4]MDQ1912195.1 NUDIX domain-containing protein [Paenibacillus sp. GD4]